MMKNWTITCHNCGDNHAEVMEHAKRICIVCPDCGKEEYFDPPGK